MIAMIDNASVSIRLQNLAARLAVPNYLNIDSTQHRRLLLQVAELEALFDEVEQASKQ
jgi:tmRNA-binding protein